VAADFIITNAVAQSLLSAFAAATDAGTAAQITIYDDTSGVPADADASIGSAVALAKLLMSATAFGSPADANPNATITADTIADEDSALATGTAAFFRIHTQDAGTTICQGTVGTSSADLVLNTVAITTGSTVSITSCVITMPEQA